MKDQWSLHDEVIVAAHRWPLIFSYILVGALLGWGASFLWPSPVRATKELYVAVNVYRWAQDRNVAAYAEGVQFNFPDDYKNWQMANLNYLVTTDRITKETLSRLKQDDVYWSAVNKDELLKMLHVYWRNAGKWRLVVEGKDAHQMSRAVEVWEQVTLETTGKAIQAAQDTLTTDVQLQETSKTHSEALAHAAALTQIRQQVQAWQDDAASWSGDRKVTENERQAVLAALQTASDEAPWQTLMAEAPGAGAGQKEFTSWLERAATTLEQEIKVADAKVTALQTEKDKLSAQYNQTAQNSLGLSPNLSVERGSDSTPEIVVIRPGSELALVGAALGLFVWAAFWLARIASRKNRQEEI